MTDILEAIDDLIKQATTERSHYYTAQVLTRAKAEIEDLRDTVELWKSRAEAAVTVGRWATRTRAGKRP